VLKKISILQENYLKNMGILEILVKAVNHKYVTAVVRNLRVELERIQSESETEHIQLLVVKSMRNCWSTTQYVALLRILLNVAETTHSVIVQFKVLSFLKKQFEKEISQNEMQSDLIKGLLSVFEFIKGEKPLQLIIWTLCQYSKQEEDVMSIFNKLYDSIMKPVEQIEPIQPLLKSIIKQDGT